MSGDIQKDECISKLDQREQELADSLKEGSRNDQKRDAELLKEMGMVYCERGLLTKDLDNFVKSSALINAALLRAHSPELATEIEGHLKNTELAFYKVLSIEPGKTPLDYKSDVKTRLDRIRDTTCATVDKSLEEIKSSYSLDVSDTERVSTEKTFNEKSRTIFAQTSADMADFFRYLISESENILGTPPQEYAAIGLGSLARGDTTPFSDIEWAILVEDESKDTAYFRNLARLVHLFVLNIQETLLKSLAIKSLNDYDTEDGNWFIDCVAVRGFQFDSAAPYACNTPLGRPDRPTKVGRELIRTPQRMAQLCEYNTALKDGYNIDRIMTSVVKIGGSSEADELVQKFTSFRASAKVDIRVRLKAFRELLEIIMEFGPILNFHKPVETVRDIKKSMFRLPTLIVTLFKSCFWLSTDTTWEVLEEMVSRKLLTSEAAHNLECVVSISSLLRLATYLHKGCQDELISLLPQKHSSGKSFQSKNIAHFNDFTVLICRYYFTVQPLVFFLFDADRGLGWVRDNRIPRDDFYNRSDLVRGVIELNCSSFDQARDHFFKHIKNRSSNLIKHNANTKIDVYNDESIFYDDTDAETQDCFSLISRTFKSEGDDSNELKYARLAYDMCKTVQTQLPKKAEYLTQMAIALMCSKNYDLSLQLFTQAIDILRNLHGDDDKLEIAIVLDNIGNFYLHVGNFDSAMNNSKSSVNMLRRLLGGEDHVDLAVSLAHLGVAYFMMLNFDGALRSLEESRDMILRLHGTGCHPQIVNILEILGVLYIMMNKFSDGLHCFSEATKYINQSPRSSDHPNIAVYLEFMYCAKIFLGKYDEAMQLLERALPLRKTSNIDTSFLFNIGLKGMYQIENFEERQRYLLKSLRIRQRFLGDHWETVQTLYAAGALLGAAEKFSESLDCFEELIRMKTKLAHNRANSNAGNNMLTSENVCLVNDGDTYIYEFVIYASDIDCSEEICKLHRLGTLHFQQQGSRDLQPALLFYKRVLHILREESKGSKDLEVAFCLDNIGRIYRNTGDYAEALQYCMESMQLRNRLNGNKDCPETAVSLKSLADVYFVMNQPKEALKYCELSISMFQRLGNGRHHREMSSVLNTLGQVHQDLGNLELALQNLEKSLETIKQVDDNDTDLETAAILTNIAKVYDAMRKYTRALQYHTDSLNLSRKHFKGGDNKFTAESLCYIGKIQESLGNVDEAMKYHVDSLNMHRSLFGDVDHLSIAKNLREIGGVHLAKGDLEKSRKYLLKSLDMKKRINKTADHHEVERSMIDVMYQFMVTEDMLSAHHKGVVSQDAVEALLIIGVAYTSTRNTEKALQNFEDSLTQARNMYGSRDHQVVGKCLNNIGAVYILTRKHQRACDFLMKSLEMKRRLIGEIDDLGIARTLNNLGMVYCRMGKVDLALQYHCDAYIMRLKLYGDKINPECCASIRRLNRVRKKCEARKSEISVADALLNTSRKLTDIFKSGLHATC